MRIVSLLENTTERADMQSEHGLSLYIETAGKRILFDMGMSDLFYQNSQILGIDLGGVDLAILSHGHYDHGGGLRTFLAINAHAPVYMRREAFLPHYNGTEKYIGLDATLSEHPRLVFTGDSHEIAPGLSLSTQNSRERSTAPASGLTERVGESFIPDDFRHEQYLLIEENGKRVLISGCSHKGILNILSWFVPDVLVGGFHFSKLPPDSALAQTSRAIAAYPTVLYTCHCTGQEQYAYMKPYIPRLHYLSCGQEIVI